MFHITNAVLEHKLRQFSQTIGENVLFFTSFSSDEDLWNDYMALTFQLISLPCPKHHILTCMALNTSHA